LWVENLGGEFFIGKLTDLKVRQIKDAGCYSDGGNLYLQVSKSCAKSWLFRYMFGGKAHEMGLGSYTVVPLNEARKKAHDLYYALHELGQDPMVVRNERRKAALLEGKNQKSFEQCARERYEVLVGKFDNPKHAAQWISTLEKYAFPKIGAIPVREIDTAVIFELLKEIWIKKTETATRVRQRIEDVLGSARVLGHPFRDGINPASWKDNLDKLLPNPSKLKKKKPTPHFLSYRCQRLWKSCATKPAHLPVRWTGSESQYVLYSMRH
jgi:hypothetical protein